MSRRPDPWPDWRDEAAYRPLLEAERSAFAWEWLRRRRDYLEAWEAAGRGSAGRGGGAGGRGGGLVRFEDPERPTPVARPLWRRDVFHYVLEIEALPGGSSEDLFELDRLASLATLSREDTGEEHVLLSDGFHNIRIDVLEGSLARGPAMLRYRLAGLAGIAEPLIVLRRLLALWQTGRF